MVNRVAVPLLLASMLFTACAVAPSAKPPAASGSTVTCGYRTTNLPAKAVDPPSGADVSATGTALVTLTFPGGPVQVTLDRAAAPCTAHSFESLAQQGFYSATKCHRMSNGDGYFFLQCGDPTGTGTGGPGYWFDDELAQTKTYAKGDVAMANSGPNTNGSQFFILFANANFPPNYTIFGHVDAAGLAVIEALGAQGTDATEGTHAGHPLGDATIKTVSVG